MKIKCPNKDCTKILVVPDELAGKKGKCSGCGTSFVVPDPKKKPSLGSSRQTGSTGSKSGSGKSGSKSAFQAAREKGSLSGKPSPSKGKGRPGAGAAGAGASRAKPPRREEDDFEVVEDDFYDDDDYGGDLYEDDLYEDDPYADDPYGADDYGSSYGDPYGAPAAPSRPSRKKGGGGKGQMGKVRVGLLLVAIGACILAGGLAVNMLAEFMGQVALMMQRSAFKAQAKEMEELSKTQVNQSNYQERFRKMGEINEKYTKKFKSAGKLGDTSITFLKIGHVVVMPGIIVCIVGYVFCLFAPNKNGALGLGIAALVLGGVNVVMRLIFKVIPVLSKDREEFYDRYLFGLVGGLIGGADETVSRVLVTLTFDLLFAAEIILFTLFMAALATIKKDRAQRGDCMKVMYVMIGFASTMLLAYLLCMIDWDLDGDQMWPLYIVRLFMWAGNILLALGFFFYISNLFYARSST